jgi:hypothetical protein
LAGDAWKQSKELACENCTLSEMLDEVEPVAASPDAFLNAEKRR